MRLPGISANGKHSVRDFDCPYAYSQIGQPKKKIVRETVPYMSGYYDFSKLYGDAAYESREINYAFDFVESTPAALHTAVSRFADWLRGIHETSIVDDEVSGSFTGTCDEIDVKYDESGMAATVSVKFTCQPFMS